MKRFFIKTLICTLFISTTIQLQAADDRIQLPGVLQHAYFGASVGYINYNFGANGFKWPSDYSYQSTKVNHAAVRLILYGYEFNPYLSAQITYMRPVNWVFYYYKTAQDGYASTSRSSVWMNVGGLTLCPRLPLTNRLSISGEAGLAVVTRHGFTSDNKQDIVSGHTYPSVLLGGAINYTFNKAWQVNINAAYTPEKQSINQPSTTFVAGGFRYKLQQISQKQKDRADKYKYTFPKQWFQLGYSGNYAGYGINNGLEKACLFWGGDVEVRQGITLNYQRNLYHSSRFFALDWGVSASAWQTKGIGSELSNPEKTAFYTLSVFPVLRFNFIHSTLADFYCYASVAGPTYISKKNFEILNKFGKQETALTGEHFTFQDTEGLGAFFGKNREYNLELKIGHYSNGNIYPNNAAIKIPVSLNVGYAF